MAIVREFRAKLDNALDTIDRYIFGITDDTLKAWWMAIKIRYRHYYGTPYR